MWIFLKSGSRPNKFGNFSLDGSSISINISILAPDREYLASEVYHITIGQLGYVTSITTIIQNHN